MHPTFLDSMSWEMAEVYGAITDQILVNLARHFPFYDAGDPLPKSAFEYQAAKLAEMGQVSKETVQIIRNGLADADLALQGVLEQAIIDAVKTAQPELLEAVKKGVFSPAGIPIVAPNQMKAFNLYYQQAANKLNLVNTVMLESTKSAYQQTIAGVVADIDLADRISRTQGALDVAAGETITGVSSWNQALRHATDRLKEGGIIGFIDHGGHRWSAEAYVAMDVRTTVFNTGRAATWETNQNFGNDLYLVSWHSGARPLCYDWQNKVISATNNARMIVDGDGNEVRVYAQSETTYGMPAGLFGINCKHYPTPFIPGVSTADGTPQDKEENDRVYAESQEQRRLERKLREEKRDLMMAKAQGASTEELNKLRDKCRKSSQDIDDFCKQTGRARHRDREAVYTKREFPDKNKYDVTRFERDQKKEIEKYFSKEGGTQKGFVFDTLVPLVPLVANPKPAAVQDNAHTVQKQPATDKFVTEYLPNRGIAELPVKQFETQPTDEEIIRRIAGADKTKGSCVSVAYAYTGNKAGYDVHDFRGGESRLTFSINANITKVAKFPGVDGYIETTVNDFTGAHKVLKNVESGKQYFFRTGKHAAIVRQGANGLEYLEMQSSWRSQGWYTLDDDALDWRFACQKSHTSFGQRYALDNVLIDVEKLGKSPDFVEMLKYINTEELAQQKGVGGGIK